MSIQSWDEVPNLGDDLLRGIYAYGYETPSSIQQKAILPLSEGKDLIAQAQSGTGKTGYFVIGSLTRLELEKPTTQVLIISPTRELSLQTRNVVDTLGAMMEGLTSQLLVGGSSSSETPLDSSSSSSSSSSESPSLDGDDLPLPLPFFKAKRSATTMTSGFLLQ